MTPVEISRLLLKAEDALSDGNYTKAGSMAERALQADRDSVRARLILAEIALDENRVEEAGALAQEILTRDAGSVGGGLIAAEVALIEDDPERVIELCTPILEGDPNDLRAQHLMAEALLDLGVVQEAARLFENILEEDEEHIDAWLGLGVCRFELGEYDQCLACMDELESLEPELADVHFYRSLCLERQGDMTAARRAFNRAHDMSPEEFPRPLDIGLEEFERLVLVVVDKLPDNLREHMTGVQVTIEDLPAEVDLRTGEPPLSPRVWGTFRGVAQGEGQKVVPSELVLYRRNLLRTPRTRDELTSDIHDTLVAELQTLLNMPLESELPSSEV